MIFYSQDLIESWCLPEDVGIVTAQLSDDMWYSLGKTIMVVADAESSSC